MELIHRLKQAFRIHTIIWIVIIATCLRLYALSTNPPGLNWDEVSMGVSAHSLLTTGKDEWGVSWPLLFRSYGEWKSPIYIYLMLPFIKIFGMNAWGVRLPAALAGIIAVYLTYLLGKKIYRQTVGLWAALFLAVSPWHLMLSRPAFEAGLALTLVLAGTYYFLRIFDNTSFATRYSIVSALLFGLSLHTYHSAKIVVPLVILFLVWVYRRVLSWRQFWLPTLILLLFVTPIMLDVATGRTQRRFGQVGITTDQELLARFTEYRQTFPLPPYLSKLVFNKYTFLLVKGTSNYTSYLSPHFLLGSESIRAQHSIPFRGVLYVTECALMLYGLARLGRQKGKVAFLPLVLILAGFIPPALTKNAYHVLRSILTLPAWQLLAALGITELGKHKLTWGKLLKGLWGLEVAIFLFVYFAWYPRAFAKDWQYGHAELAAYVQSVESHYQHIVMSKMYGEPQIFMAFYDQWDPTSLHKEMPALLGYEQLALPWLDQLPVYSLGKWTFRDIDWSQDQFAKDTLVIGKRSDFYVDTPILWSLDFPDGTNAFAVAAGR
jgi:4-amino-4-deoxy-L-arabinose transferase-like glycosyltransferase